MEPRTPELVQQVLIESILQCVQDGDIRIAVNRVRGSLEVLDLDLDSLGGINLAVAFLTKFTERTGQMIGDDKADSVMDVLFDVRDAEGGTVSQASTRIFKLLSPKAA